MKKLATVLAIASVGLSLIACGSKEAAEPELKGKVDVQDAPKGTVAPGDARGQTTSETRPGGN